MVKSAELKGMSDYEHTYLHLQIKLGQLIKKKSENELCFWHYLTCVNRYLDLPRCLLSLRLTPSVKVNFSDVVDPLKGHDEYQEIGQIQHCAILL